MDISVNSSYDLTNDANSASINVSLFFFLKVGI